MISIIIFRAFIIWAIIQGIYALYFFARYVQRPALLHTASKQPGKPVSILICARNEAINLKANLPSVLSQRYHDVSGKPMYEVVVIDDSSTDDTRDLLSQLQQQYQHLRIATIPAGEPRTLKGKKFALDKAVSIAANDWLLLTDADCAPAGKHWLASMVAPLAAGKEIVGGYGAYYPTRSWLNAFIRWETMHTFLQFSTYARAGKPYMAVGRNISCTKDILQLAQRSPNWDLLPSGDDDMLINIAATSGNMAIVDDQEAFTYSHTKDNFADWVTQKQRHVSTGKYYTTQTKLRLGLYGFTHAAVWFYFIALLFTSFVVPAIYIMAVRCVMYWILWAVTAQRLHEKRLIIKLPLLDIAWMLYNFTFLPYILFKNKKNWK